MQLISFDGFERIVSVSRDALVDGEEEEFESVVVSFVQRLHDVGENSRVFATGSADGNAIPALKEAPGHDRVVNLSLGEKRGR